MFQTLTNLIYLLSAGAAFDKRKWETIPMTIAMVLLAVFSAMFHMHEWIGEPSQFYQRMDVSAIYLILGLFPFTITLSRKALFMLLPAAVLIANKFGVIGGSTWDSQLMVPLLSIPTLIAGFVHIKRHFFWDAIALIVVAFGYALISNNFEAQFWGYDQPHGMWHLLSGFSFIVLLMGIETKEE